MRPTHVQVFLIPGFKYGGFMALITNLTYCACAFAELYYQGKLKPKASFVDYAKLSFTTFVGTPHCIVIVTSSLHCVRDVLTAQWS